MLKHVFWLGLAIAVGLAVAKMFGGTFNLTSLFSGLTGSTTATTTSVTPCHLAAIAFGEDFRSGPRVNQVRHYLRKFEKEGPGQAALVRIYRENGRKLAARVERSRFLSALNRMLFRAVLRRAEA
jgi:hypothetical protein